MQIPTLGGSVLDANQHSDTLIGDWGGRFNSSGSASGEIKLRITERDNENYTGHILEISGGNPSLICKGAPIKLNRRGSRYAVSFNRRNVCHAKGEFIYTGQALNGEVLFERSRSRVGISLTRLGRDISSVQTLAAGNHQVERNLTLAAQWFEKSADQGYADAQFALGLMYDAGIGGLSNDFDKAMELYQKAADQGHPKAQYGLGNAYYCGHGVSRDMAQALIWYRKAAERADVSEQVARTLCGIFA